MPKLTYAMRNGGLIHVSDVPSGLACECTCPSCGGQLVAKKGESQVHHFAHYDVEECSSGYETSLHLLAKSVISEYKSILLPPVYVFKTDPEWKITNEKIVAFDKVELEVFQGNIVPDIVGTIGDKQLYIEIRVAHAVDNSKKSKIIDHGLSCIEIDLSSLNGEITRDILANYLMTDYSKSKWIFNAHSEKYQKMLTFFQQKIDLVHRGYALHAETCPITVRSWRGIPYANFIDDCSHCPFLRDYHSSSQTETKSTGYIFCSGQSRIGCIDDLKEKLSKT